MQLDLDLVAKHLKCKPWRKISNQVISSASQILDHWLPPILPHLVKEDFLEFFKNKLSGKMGWLRSCVDSSFTKFKVEFGLGGYRGLPDFIDWDNKLDGQFLEHMLPLLQSIAECTNTPITTAQFFMLATELCKFSNFPLSSLDVSIIKTFNQMPTITVPALARLLGKSYKKVRNRWKRLQKLGICKIQAKINYPILGLVPVIIELHDSKSAIRSPYLVSRLELSGDLRCRFFMMAVPEKALSALSHFLDSHFGTTHTLYVVKDLGQIVEFTHYHIIKEDWNIDWKKLLIGVHLLHNDWIAQDTSYYDEEEHQTLRLYFPDDKDKRLIPILMSDARVKLEKLAQISGMSIAQASRRKSKLVELGVLRLEPLIRRVGLIEDIVIRMKKGDARINGLVKELPQAWIRQITEFRSGNKEILVYATLPAGSFALMRYYLSRYLQTESDIYISSPASGGWPLSFEPFDVRNGQWMWQDPVIVEEPKISQFEILPEINQTPNERLTRGDSLK